MLTLRPDQIDLQTRILASMKAGHKSVLAVAPTGYGKTFLFCDYTNKVSKNNKKTMILSHREELVEQISNTLKIFNVKHSFIASGHPYNENCLTQVASVMSLVSRIKKWQKAATIARANGKKDPPFFFPNLIIVDEAHHSNAGSWKFIFNFFKDVYRIGFTATAQRLDGKPMGEYYDDIIIGPTAGELIAQGSLSPYKVIAPDTPELADIHHRGGDFDAQEVVKKRPRSLVGDAVAHYAKYAAGKRAVVFEVTVAEAHLTAAKFMSAGFRAAVIDGTMDRGKRRETVNLFRDGYLDQLVTVDLISEGFDLPAIECAIMLRPTESLSLWIQQFGRALRTYPGKDQAIILDHAGNTLRHMWLPETVIDWSLTGPGVIRSTGSDSGPAIRTCPFCHAAQFSKRGVNVCKQCGTPMVAQAKDRKVDMIEGELRELTVEEVDRISRQKRLEQGLAQTKAELVELFRRRGEKNPEGHAHHVWIAREAKRLRAEAGRFRSDRVAGLHGR